jgi:hypothetical protein
MNINREAVHISFEKPVNADWMDDPFTEAPHFVTFHPEILAPRKAFTMDGMSPFVAVALYFNDYGYYQAHEVIRTRVREEFWESVKRAVVHFERRQWPLFTNEVETILEERLKKTFKERARQMSEIIGYSVQWFTFRYEHLWKSEAVHFARAFLSHPDVLRNLAEDYRTSGRLIHIWRQITSLHDDYVGKYPSWMPILQLRYWKAKPKDVDNLVVSDKRFDELKPIYLNAFELLGRMSTIALAVELIAATGATNVPTKKGSMAIWEFEQMDNGTKPNQLVKYAGTKHLVPLLKTELRNGIGHNAAHYDPVTDEVVCIKETGATLKEWRISYTGFCLATVELVSNAFFLEQYFFDLLGMSKDLFPSRKQLKKRV